MKRLDFFHRLLRKFRKSFFAAILFAALGACFPAKAAFSSFSIPALPSPFSIPDWFPFVNEKPDWAMPGDILEKNQRKTSEQAEIVRLSNEIKCLQTMWRSA